MAAKIDRNLLLKIMAKTGLSQSTAYARIARVATDQALTQRLAALSFARANGIAINRFASAEDLATLRNTVSSAAPIASVDSVAPQAPAKRRLRGAPSKAPRKQNNSVFVVHGRDDKLREAIFTFLHAAGVQPIEWSKAISMTKKPSPYVGEVLDVAFSRAQAVVVLLTPDDEAVLKKKFWHSREQPFEKKLTGQARPNVLFEAGMAFGSHADHTVLVEIGELRPFSDTYGRHVVRLSNSSESRKQLMIKLQNAGCTVDFEGNWNSAGDFEPK